MTVYKSSRNKLKTRTYPTRIATGLHDIVYNSNGSINTDNLVGDITYSTGNEVIAYSTKPKRLRHLSNFCSHTRHSKLLAGGVRVHTGVATNPNPDGTYALTSVDGHAVISSATAYDNFITAIGNSIGGTKMGLTAQGSINDAFALLKPDLTELSVPNFLLELNQIPDLFQRWKTNLSLLKNLANKRLQWSFGWKPFLGDLEAMKSVITSVYQRCVEWNNKAGEELNRQKLIATYNDSSSGNFVYPSGSHKTYWEGYRVGKLSAHFKFKTQEIPELRTMEGVLRVYLDALGFELNPRIIWDAIPFSFVLDWFFDVGGWCNRFKMDTLTLPVELVDSYLQYKEELRCETHWERASDGLYIPQPRSGPVFEVNQFFGRLPIFPDQSAATAASWRIPGPNQLINLFSLATILKR